MKKKMMLFGSILVVFALILLGTYFFYKHSSGEGSLKVLCSPVAKISIDGKDVGSTASGFFETALKEGTYKLRLVPTSGASDTVSWEGQITIYPGRQTHVSRELGSTQLNSSGTIFTMVPATGQADSSKGEIEVKATPKGAIVYIDGEEQGIAPVVLPNVTKGQHEISVYTPGFFRRSAKVVIEPKYRVVAEFQLAIDPSYKDIEDLKKKEATESAALATGSASLTKTPTPTVTSKVTPTATKTTLTPTPSKTLTTTPSAGGGTIVITDTPTGFLRVRDQASASGAELAQVKPGDTFTSLAESNGWIQIEYVAGKKGWVSAQYTKKQ